MTDALTIDVSPLTQDEAGQIEGQVDRIMAILAGLDAQIVGNSIDISVALAEVGAAQVRLAQLKNEKSRLVERARNLKTLLANCPQEPRAIAQRPEWASGKAQER